MRVRGPLLCATWLLLAPPAHAAIPYHTNLIVNGDAESDPGQASGANDIDVTGWDDPGVITAVLYGASNFPDAFPTDPGPPDAGLNFFFGGVAPTSTMSQEIDLSDAAGPIDLGNVGFRLSGWFGGLPNQADDIELELSFLDGSSMPVGGAHVIGRDLVNHLNDVGLFAEQVFGDVPANARTARLQLRGTLGLGSFIDGYADSLSLELIPKALAWEGTLALRYPTETPVTLTGAGVATLELLGGPSLHLAPSLTGTGSGTGSGLFPGLQADLSLGSGSLALTSDLRGGGGVLPIRGLIRLCLMLASCNTPGAFALLDPLTSGSTLGAGIGGTVQYPSTTVSGPFFSIIASPWTLGSASLTLPAVVSSSGFAHGPLSFTSTAIRNSGALQVVTPIQVGGGTLAFANPVGGIFGVLTIHFVPEPRAALLLVSGVVALLILGGRRIRP